MEREVSIVTEIGVSLIALSAVIGIIWFTVFMGNTIGNEVSVEASEIVANMEVGALNDLCDVNTVLPTSAVYSILRTYGSYIPDSNSTTDSEFRCNIGSTVDTNISCVLTHMTGKVSLEVHRTDEGWYSAEIHHVNCNWFNDSTLKREGNIRCQGCIDAENS